MVIPAIKLGCWSCFSLAIFGGAPPCTQRWNGCGIPATKMMVKHGGKLTVLWGMRWGDGMIFFGTASNFWSGSFAIFLFFRICEQQHGRDIFWHILAQRLPRMARLLYYSKSHWGFCEQKCCFSSKIYGDWVPKKSSKPLHFCSASRVYLGASKSQRSFSTICTWAGRFWIHPHFAIVVEHIFHVFR